MEIFVSGQTELKNLLGGMADFTIKKDAESGKISIEDYSLVPLVMHYNSDFSEAGMYKLSDYTEELQVNMRAINRILLMRMEAVMDRNPMMVKKMQIQASA